MQKGKKITPFSGIQEFKFEGQFIGFFINRPFYNGEKELFYLSGKGNRSQQMEKEEKCNEMYLVKVSKGQIQ